MLSSSLMTGEDPGTFHYDVHSNSIPLQILRISFCGHANGLPVHHNISNLHFNRNIQSIVNRIIFQQIIPMLYIHQTIYSHYFHMLPLRSDPKGDPSNSSKTIYSYLSTHNKNFYFNLF